MTENLNRLLAVNRRLTEDLAYYVTLTDLLETEVEELREALKSAKGQLAIIKQDVTYPAQVA